MHSRQKTVLGQSEGVAVRARRILLAEDTPANQFLLVRLLQTRGHEVRVASNGQEAVDLYEREPFDLILMDLHMPMMDGFEATTRIRQAERQSGRHVPIVAVTAYSSLESRARCMSVGMDTFIAKPIDIHEFLRLVESFPLRADDERSS